MSSSTDWLRRSLDLWWSQSDRDHPGNDAGVEANRRLTAVSGSVLVLLLTLVVLSGLVFGWSPALHYFLGFAAIPLTLLKLASTGWRFLGYYVVRSRRYRSAGPPSPLPRLLAPVVVASGVAAFVTGVVLFFQGTDRGTVASLHTDSAVVFILAVLLHAAIHLRTTWRVTIDDVHPTGGGTATLALRGVTTRRALVVGACVAGLVLAVALVGGYHWTLVRHHVPFREG